MCIFTKSKKWRNRADSPIFYSTRSTTFGSHLKEKTGFDDFIDFGQILLPSLLDILIQLSIAAFFFPYLLLEEGLDEIVDLCLILIQNGVHGITRFYFDLHYIAFFLLKLLLRVQILPRQFDISKAENQKKREKSWHPI